jgi:hypothetical protein
MENNNSGFLNEEALRTELIETFGLGSMLPEDQNATLDNLMEALIKTIFLRTFDRLGEAGMAEYEKVLERATGPEPVSQFLEQKIPGYNVFVREIVEDFKHSFVEDLESGGE